MATILSIFSMVTIQMLAQLVSSQHHTYTVHRHVTRHQHHQQHNNYQQQHNYHHHVVNVGNLQNFASQSPQQIQRTITSLENPYVARILVSTNGRYLNNGAGGGYGNGRGVPVQFDEPLLDASFQNYIVQAPFLDEIWEKISPDKTKLMFTMEDLLMEPYFVKFFEYAKEQGVVVEDLRKENSAKVENKEKLEINEDWIEEETPKKRLKNIRINIRPINNTSFHQTPSDNHNEVDEIKFKVNDKDIDIIIKTTETSLIKDQKNKFDTSEVVISTTTPEILSTIKPEQENIKEINKTVENITYNTITNKENRPTLIKIPIDSTDDMIDNNNAILTMKEINQKNSSIKKESRKRINKRRGTGRRNRANRKRKVVRKTDNNKSTVEMKTSTLEMKTSTVEMKTITESTNTDFKV